MDHHPARPVGAPAAPVGPQSLLIGSHCRVGVLGAGAMGTGIAQVAAARGHEVVLVDTSEAALGRARDGLATAFGREVDKGRMTVADADAALARVATGTASAAGAIDAFRGCGLVIEAIVERLDAKRESFVRVEAAVDPGCVLATNTSSLSVTSIAAGCARPARVLGVHFFNPAPVMPLVELVPGVATDPGVLAAVGALVDEWGKTTVVAADTPGFIVNRIARPFYGEALRLYDEGLAEPQTVDWAMRELGGFRMGPFELMDFIGLDVNFAVSRSVFEAFFHDPRYRPSLTQQRMVEAGLLGRKAGRGFYDYAPGAVAPAPHTDRAAGEAIVERIVGMLMNEAADAVYLRVATPGHVDLAMTKGVNYPRGLLRWADEWGAARVVNVLDALYDEYRDGRYRASPLLRRMAREERRFFDG